jgi:SAM-dependent methyltransferase
VKLAVAALALALLLALRRSLGARTMDVTPLAFLKVPFNALAFRARSLLGFRRGPPPLAHEPKDDLFAHEEDPAVRARLEARERELRGRYDLAPLAAASTRAVYRDNLYVLDVLERGLGPAPENAPETEAARVDGGISALDVGSKDFRYAFALARWLARRSGGVATEAGITKVALVGIELDGHPVYPDLRSRADHADAFAAQAGPDVSYRVGDFLAAPERDRDVVFVFFPFVLRYALVRWGLPMGHFRPAPFFEHAARCLRVGGLLVIVNHTLEEHARQLEILAAIPELEVVAIHAAESALVDYAAQTEGRRVTVARRVGPA